MRNAGEEWSLSVRVNEEVWVLSKVHNCEENLPTFDKLEMQCILPYEVSGHISEYYRHDLPSYLSTDVYIIKISFNNM